MGQEISFKLSGTQVLFFHILRSLKQKLETFLRDSLMIRLKWPWFFEGILYWFIDSEADKIFLLFLSSFARSHAFFQKKIYIPRPISRNRLFSLPKVAK